MGKHSNVRRTGVIYVKQVLGVSHVPNPVKIGKRDLECAKCELQFTILFTEAEPDVVSCPRFGCDADVWLYKCIACGVHFEEENGDQGFIELSIPYGSTVHDSLFDGPARVCSTKCLLEAFKNDTFDAKGMLPSGKKS